MTDKQIIIDGFNLEYIKKLLYNGQRSAITTNIFEAIIEELEHKEQECERLNNTITNLEKIRDEFSTKLDQLKAENEVLKQYKASKQASYESMQRQWNEAINKNRKLKQTLTEIKEYCESQVRVEEKNKYKTNGYIVAFDILQKISECEVVDEQTNS